MLGLDRLDGHVADACDCVDHLERFEDGLLPESRDLHLAVLSLLENSLHQEDVQVYLLETHSDKVRVVLVELRAAPGLSLGTAVVLRSSSL